MENKPKFRVIFYTDNELRFSSYLHTGLYDLSQKGIISYSHRIPKNNYQVKEILCSRIDVTDLNTGFSKKIAFDWADSPRTIYVNKLASCDVYYKRNYIPDISLKYCPNGQENKIVPLGLVINCRSFKERPFWVRLIGAFYKFENKGLELKSLGPNIKKMIYSIQAPVNLLEERVYYPANQGRLENT